MSDKYKETKEKWRNLNKDRVNARRRELRAKKRLEKFKETRCLLCQFPLSSKFAGCIKARVYCNDCTKRNFTSVSRHKYNRYYAKKQQYKGLQDKTSMAYFRVKQTGNA